MAHGNPMDGQTSESRDCVRWKRRGKTRISRRMALAGILSMGATGSGGAADWPEKTMTWIVPYPAGGGSDTFARPVAAAMLDNLKKSIVIDNKSGAGGTLGTAIAAHATPDGYTILLGDTGLTYAPLVYPAADFNFSRDFAPISALARVPYVLAVNPQKLEVGSLPALIEEAKRRPGAIDIGSAGLGTVTHLAINLLEEHTGIKLNHIPYRGGAPMLQDLLAGQIGAAFVVPGALAPHLKSGKLRGLAIAGRRRVSVLADVPTMSEAGVAEFRVAIWFGLFAPRKTPDSILDRLHGAAQQVLQADSIKRLWAEQGATVELESRADFTRFVADDSERWSRIARAANVKLE